MASSSNVDDSDNIVVGKSFATYETAVEFIEKFCKKNSHPVRRESKTSVSQYNKKVKEDQKIIELNGDDMYGIRWVCKHFGTFKSRTKGGEKTHSKSHFNRGCGFFVYVAWCKQSKCYTIKNCCTEHQMHKTGPSMYALYPSNR